jgi:citrate lyase subunit beta/citryl-CoA lyase
MTHAPSSSTGRILRSWMFVPGNREKFLRKTETLDLDVALFDCEDGVLPSEKATARQMVASVLQGAWTGRAARYVRVNAISTPWFVDDLEAIVCPGLEGICLTKVESPRDVQVAAERLTALERRAGMPVGQVRIVAAIESARSLILAPEIARADPRLIALIFGAEDYALDVGLPALREGEASRLIHARSTIVNAAVAARILAIDGVFPDLENPEGCLADMKLARELGFPAKSTFNPRQIAQINEIFAPGPAEIEYARTVVRAFEEAQARGDASVAVRGQLVDLPILMRAQRVIADTAGA